MRRQMVLKTFAACNGDVPSAARTLGIADAELRAELAALLRPDAANGSAPAPAPQPNGDGHELGLEQRPTAATKPKAKRAR